MKKVQSLYGGVVVSTLIVLGAQAVPRALAHRLVVSAFAEGRSIRGSAYLSGGTRLKGATVRVLDGEGRELGRTETDPQGGFSYTAQTRRDHVLVVQTGAGHRATCTVKASELPRSLPSPGDRAGKGAEGGDHPDREGDEEGGEKSAADSAPSRADIQKMVREAVGRQIRPLRRDVQRYRSEVRFTDIVGGIGYIFGVMGLILYLKSKGRCEG